ncbi:type II toxin-antitoxin system RelE/ParE family toxin [Thermus thermophilus]|uniref:type II toxin-antitoxin system RelE/ParE family toxin n=1 Tax=Thermus thermophilus TaxID=274 RepID=UPI001FCB95BF|nr:type II toxin-antitoxin system RelE/ParE family toxin [Thermus thermophilus]BDG29811.1 hypothetical protein TthSNM76_20210 [Thermus thermophilus]
MAQYRVELYRDARGYSQVLEFFNTLKRSNPKLLAFAQRLLKNLEEHGPDLRPPLAKPLKGLQAPIWELRHPSGLRLYYWRQGATLFVVAAGEVKKDDKPDPALLELAVRAYRESQRSAN